MRHPIISRNDHSPGGRHRKHCAVTEGEKSGRHPHDFYNPQWQYYCWTKRIFFDGLEQASILSKDIGLGFSFGIDLQLGVVLIFGFYCCRLVIFYGCHTSTVQERVATPFYVQAATLPIRLTLEALNTSTNLLMQKHFYWSICPTVQIMKIKT